MLNTMKKNVLICFMLLCSLVYSYAQAPELKEFINKKDELAKELQEAIAKKDYKAGENICREFIIYYEKQPAQIQKQFIQLKYNCYYNMACYQSLQRNKNEALESFEKACVNGELEMSYTHITKDADLKFIRNEKKFQEIMLLMKNASDYLHILKQANGYEQSQRPDTLPQFIYAEPSNPDLVKVREYFKLDSVAGKGDEISKIQNILTYIHNKIKHDGQHSNPKGGANAINFAEVCKDGSRGLNCRGLATVLNECYLSMGIKSRFVTCMPKKYVNDCHVINAVYSTTLNKWLWMDPTNNAWVMDQKGNLLSIQEVRQRLSEDLPLVLNKKANWNNKEKVKAENYLYNYMAKNLYYVNCNLRYEFNTEGNSNPDSYSVNLMPKGFTTTYQTKNKKDFNDDVWFWQSPYEGK